MFFFFKQKTAYEMLRSLVGSEMCIRDRAKTKDITGGLPRVVELFEARRPKEPAVITEIDGVVKYGDIAKQHRKIFVTSDENDQREYQLPRGAHINVQEAERVLSLIHI